MPKDLEEMLAQFADAAQISQEEVLQIERIIIGADDLPLPGALETESAAGVTPAACSATENAAAEQYEDVRSIISKAKLPQKIKLALFGNSVCRGILIRDSSKMVQQFVLKNPRLQPREVDEFSRNPNIAEGVLRAIAGNSNWMKSYAVKFNLVTNPKTPGDIALKWLHYLNLGDLRRIAKSKNVPQVVSMTARKKVTEADKTRG